LEEEADAPAMKGSRNERKAATAFIGRQRAM
jgi:hypothetical protein